MPLTHVPATLSDIDFIISLIVSGARKGHFFADLASNKTEVRAHVNSIVKYGMQGQERVRSQASIGWLGDKRVGITIVTETKKMDNSIEIGVIAVRKQFQGAGYGAMLLDALLGQWLPHKTVYVRCFPRSEKLRQMLLHRGFVEIARTDKGTSILKRVQDQIPEHGLAVPVMRSTAV